MFFDRALAKENAEVWLNLTVWFLIGEDAIEKNLMRAFMFLFIFCSYFSLVVLGVVVTFLPRWWHSFYFISYFLVNESIELNSQVSFVLLRFYYISVSWIVLARKRMFLTLNTISNNFKILFRQFGFADKYPNLFQTPSLYKKKQSSATRNR